MMRAVGHGIAGIYLMVFVTSAHTTQAALLASVASPDDVDAHVVAMDSSASSSDFAANGGPINFIAVAPHTPSTLYVATGCSGILKSTGR